jgi:hypothetical protein
MTNNITNEQKAKLMVIKDSVSQAANLISSFRNEYVTSDHALNELLFRCKGLNEHVNGAIDVALKYGENLQFFPYNNYYMNNYGYMQHENKAISVASSSETNKKFLPIPINGHKRTYSDPNYVGNWDEASVGEFQNYTRSTMSSRPNSVVENHNTILETPEIMVPVPKIEQQSNEKKQKNINKMTINTTNTFSGVVKQSGGESTPVTSTTDKTIKPFSESGKKIAIGAGQGTSNGIHKDNNKENTDQNDGFKLVTRKTKNSIKPFKHEHTYDKPIELVHKYGMVLDYLHNQVTGLELKDGTTAIANIGDLMNEQFYFKTPGINGGSPGLWKIQKRFYLGGNNKLYFFNTETKKLELATTKSGKIMTFTLKEEEDEEIEYEYYTSPPEENDDKPDGKMTVDEL